MNELSTTTYTTLRMVRRVKEKTMSWHVLKNWLKDHNQKRYFSLFCFGFPPPQKSHSFLFSFCFQGEQYARKKRGSKKKKNEAHDFYITLFDNTRI